MYFISQLLKKIIGVHDPKFDKPVNKDNSESLSAVIKSLRSRKDFASKNSGATILLSSKGIQNAASILSKSNDEYLLMPHCNGDQD